MIAGQVFKNLSVLRVEPTPFVQKDNAAYGKDLYRLLSSRLIQSITESKEPVGEL
ncbi:hypothetical protein LCY76_20695 [Fictibacillus sp. KIGAM418]|uniref:Uncharacterized protein n=1 Tax=Fictibacillus marinisediminis TaxID=2878389 RepID=A0A9X1XDW1_9BACL|nr:hypothetical protein [Fictibacillus marinisediminis]MCK6258994.1 hypothetical protein [Fictibacillus marinisediminis]